MNKQNRITLWLELHGPGLAARNVKWSYDFDRNRYTFWREVDVSADVIADSAAPLAQSILEKLNG